jgi:pyridinium-3,5-bisthiocarboxylic acid mononucleotide nickel chelatase
MNTRMTQNEPAGHIQGAAPDRFIRAHLGSSGHEFAGHQDSPIPKRLHLHFAPITGIAGDMAVAALVDAGVPESVILNAIRAMHIPGLIVGFHEEQGTPGLHFEVTWAAHPHGHSHDHGHPHEHWHEHPVAAHAGHAHRPYAEIRRLLQAADLPADCRALAEKMFARLASVEARIHGQPVEDVTFHEVGAYDSIADIVGVAAAVAWLAPSSISASPPLLGRGTVECAHGTLPVPAPATASLLSGYSTLDGGEGEMTTPTGALVLTSLVETFGPPPPLRVVSQGAGIGTKKLLGQPNALTVVLGELAKADQ